MKSAAFATLFQHLTAESASPGHPPFLWQKRLYQRLLTGDIPPLCDIPTGLGKTSVIALWLLALAEQASQPGTPLTLPRRLVYVVNRRVVVDQATDDAKHLFDNLHAAQDGPLLAVADALRNLSVLPAEKPAKPGESAGLRPPPFALSTLRGQFADNRAWSADPCRPAIIVGTVDMIGSRLLFSAYRAGYRTKPLYAAFLGQDALVVHDEAHLEPAFQKLLDDLRAEQRQSADAKPIQVMQLSATTRRGTPENGFTLEPADEAEEKVAERLRAVKRLTIHPAVDTKQLPERLAKLAFDHQGPDVAVLVFARRLDTVEKTAEALRNKIAKVLGKKAAEDQVQTLTGTMRGLERDGLAKDPVFRRFLKPPANGWSVPTRPGTVYLVCTSAGEVGVDLSANHLVSDLTTFESMAQRFGRVNRFGKFSDTRVDVVPTDALNPDDAERLAATEAILARLDGDASLAALRRLALTPEERAAAFNRSPAMLETSGILFDAWALTSITDPLPGRPPVEPYLHGVLESEEPVTQVAWRDEVQRLTDKEGNLIALFRDEDLKTLLADYPLKPPELLQDRSYRVAETLAKLAKRKSETLALPVWLQDSRGEVSRFTLATLLDKRNKDRLDHNLLLLPPSLGCLSGGMLDPGSDTADDVSDAWLDENRQPRRQRVSTAVAEEPEGMEKMRLIRCIDTRPDSPDESGEEAAPSAQRFWWWYEAPAGADTEGSSYARKAVRLSVHTGDVQELARQFAAKLGLPTELVEAVRIAGKFHDSGKDRRDWQQSIGNFGSQALAKSDGKKSARAIPTDYRHEFGSLMDLLADPEFQALSETAQDLTLHLIAAHHGRARPHFDPDEIFDRQHPKAQSDALAAETPRRFARLQRRHGRWGLAFLESLLRAADYAASANPSATVGDPQP